MKDWTKRFCLCGHSKYDYADEHDEVPTGSGYCSKCDCVNYRQRVESQELTDE